MDNDDLRAAQILEIEERAKRYRERQRPLLPTDRYQSDPLFRRLVDSFSAAIENADFTPTEIREAAMLAQILYEETHLKPILLDTVRHTLTREPPWK